jgi:hypothetical protein
MIVGPARRRIDVVRIVKLGIKRPAYRPLLPDPEPRPVCFTLISVDDHLMEPPDAFEGRLPARLQDRAPRVIETEEGHQVWTFEDTPYFQVGFMCVAGRPREDHRVEPARYEEVRAGCWSIKDRIKDMDIAGIWASLNFPSGVTGFGGTLFSEAKDPELGLACVRAWNDWLFGSGTRPSRSGSCRSASRSWPIPCRAPRRSGATRSAASRP